MILQNTARKGVRQIAACYNIQYLANFRRASDCFRHGGVRCYGSERGVSNQLRDELARERVKTLEKQQKARREAKALDKDFFLSILGSSATKREAKAYLQRFDPSAKSIVQNALPIITDQKSHQLLHGNGVNLGVFQGPAAVQRSPKFDQYPERSIGYVEAPQLHVALVKIRAPQTLDNDIINGIGKTLSQLGRLGLMSVVVVDCQHSNNACSNWRAEAKEQASRIVAAIDSNGEGGARYLNNIIGISGKPEKIGHYQTAAHVTLRKLLMTPLRRGIIPVVPSLGYTDNTQTATHVLADHVVLALTRELAGLPGHLLPDEDPNVVRSRLQTLHDEISLDRLIILDPLGGIPAVDGLNGYHVFLNMEQEYSSVRKELLKKLKGPMIEEVNSQFHEVGLPGEDSGPRPDNWYHIQNLQLVQCVLSILPPSSSALLTTPNEAANSGRDAPFQAARVGTRRQRNPLIHNLLTDKPAFSSSLPASRLGQQNGSNEAIHLAESSAPTTFVKHGMSVTIFPDPKLTPWEPPIPGEPQLNLTDSQIDLPRLVYLIEDSFGRKLDIKDYLKRVNGRIAGVIIAGEYEGGALLTWETPPGVKDDGSPESRARMVPYLDKFAVLRRSQGSGGVADLIFKSMVRDCFPNGVVWRSRKSNPVNKWYFERSRGAWKLPGTEWTMFWTTPEPNMSKQLFLDYEGVCRRIRPSWADNQATLD